MKAVGVKVLKAKLSEYLRLVKAGETVLITERDEVVAELRPARRQAPNVDLDDRLAAWAEQGRATLASRSVAEWRGFTSFLSGSGATSTEILDELRRDPT